MFISPKYSLALVGSMIELIMLVRFMFNSLNLVFPNQLINSVLEHSKTGVLFLSPFLKRCLPGF